MSADILFWYRMPGRYSSNFSINSSTEWIQDLLGSRAEWSRGEWGGRQTRHRKTIQILDLSLKWQIKHKVALLIKGIPEDGRTGRNAQDEQIISPPKVVAIQYTFTRTLLARMHSSTDRPIIKRSINLNLQQLSTTKNQLYFILPVKNPNSKHKMKTKGETPTRPRKPQDIRQIPTKLSTLKMNFTIDKEETVSHMKIFLRT